VKSTNHCFSVDEIHENEIPDLCVKKEKKSRTSDLEQLFDS
jgi:hypothetical protein